MRAKDFIKEDHGFLAPGSHNWEREVGDNIWNYLKNLPSGAWKGFKNVTGIGDDDHDHDHDHDHKEPKSQNLAAPKATHKTGPDGRVLSQTDLVKKSERNLRSSNRKTRDSSRTGRISRFGGEEDDQ